MTTAINLPNTQYNKTEYAKLNVTESKTIHFSEAVYSANDERITILAYVTDVPDIKCFDNKDYKFEPQVCTFEVLLKPYTYKDKETKPTFGMMICAESLKAIPAGTPFSGSLNFSGDTFEYECIVKGESQGKPIPEEMRTIMTANYHSIAPLVELDKLKGLAIPEAKKSGSGGFRGETTADRIAARVAFLKKVAAEPGDILELCAFANMDITKFMEVSLSKILD